MNKSSLTRDIYGIKNLNLNTIISQATYNFRYIKYGKTYYIQLDRNKLIPGTFITYDKVCALIDKGNTQVTGSHIFSDALKDVEENFSMFLDAFLSGRI